VDRPAVFLADHDPRHPGWWHLIDFTGHRTECGIDPLPGGPRMEWRLLPSEQLCQACKVILE
jgi:hypothetical protein